MRQYTEEQRARHNAYVADAKRTRNAAGAEIGEIPLPKDPSRRRLAEASLSAWAEVYCKSRHRNPDSRNHATMYAALDRSIRSGETWLALQAPRGEAKSFKTSEALVYAVMTGRKKFICCFTASMATTSTLAQYFEGQFLDEHSVFAEDYPEIFCALRTQGSYAQRKVTYEGRDTELVWGAVKNGKIVYQFPRLRGFPLSGAVVVLQSITSKIRGMGIVDENGMPLRPDLCMLDDVQDLDISRSEDRIGKLLEKLGKDIVGLSGDDPLSLIVLGTPFHDQCFMARVLKDKRFDGISLQAIYKFPDRMDLWEAYRKRWESVYDEKVLEYGTNEKGKAAREAYLAASQFYQEHREAMDSGCEISWPERYAKKYTGVSAIENIMREYLIILGEEAFNQEKQCIVGSLQTSNVEHLDEDRFLGKITALPEWTAPDWASKLTAAIDVHGNVLYWTLAAWGPSFDGHTCAYGTFPKQPATSWKQKRVPVSLRRVFPGAGEAGSLRAGLEALVSDLLGRQYFREDGSEIYLEKIIIDNNNGTFKKTVTNFLKEYRHREKLVGYVGDWYGSGHQPRKRSEEGGLEWKYNPEVPGRREIIAFRDFWKAYALARWLTPLGEKGCMTLYHGGPSHHRRFFAEMTAKKYRPYRLRSGKEILRWDDKAEGDDHYGDCDTMNFIAASICGIGQDAEAEKPRRSRKVKLSELQKRKNYELY